MSGSRKHVKQSSLQKFAEPKGNERIMQVVGPRGSNLIEVDDGNNRQTLCMLPAKFHKILWLKRGNFVVVDEGDSNVAEASGSKVTGTITAVLFKEDVQALQARGEWPAAFPSKAKGWPEGGEVEKAEKDKGKGAREEGGLGEEESEDDMSEDGLPPLEGNPNHRAAVESEDSDSEEEEEERR